MSDSREQFEAAAKAQGMSVTRTHQALAFANGSRRSAGDYIAIETVCAWWAWQASRQALVVELPAIGGAFTDVQKNTRNRCRQSIEAAGVRIKT